MFFYSLFYSLLYDFTNFGIIALIVVLLFFAGKYIASWIYSVKAKKAYDAANASDDQKAYCILNRVSEITGVCISLIRSEKRTPVITAARALFVKLAIKEGFGPVKISKYINKDYSTVSYYRDFYSETRFFKEFHKKYNDLYEKDHETR